MVAGLDVDADESVNLWRRLKAILGSSPQKEHVPQGEGDNVDSVTERWKLLTRYQEDIPHCSLNCIYELVLDYNCAHTDFACICTRLEVISQDVKFKSCYDHCPINPDQRWTPGRLLDFCELVGVQPALPDYMSQYSELHRRQPVEARAFAQESGATGGRVSVVTVYSTATRIHASTSDAEVLTSTMTITASWVSAIQTVLVTKTATGFSTSQISSVSTYLPTATPEPVDPSLQSTGLSTGAKAGIGVAIPLAVICIASILLWYIRRKKKNGGDGGGHDETQLPTTISPTSPAVNNLPFEKDGNAINELDGQQNSETDAKSKTTIFELDANLTTPEKDQGQQKEVTSGDSLTTVGAFPRPSSMQEEMSGPANICGFNTPRESQEGNPSHAYEEMSLADLEEELARVARRKERLQHLESLENTQEALRRLIAARKKE
ncbi:hypothetical protein IFM46972_04668 [Aspergillus udagawae]|uniref:CFEM domain-containing protein n=1 Tax=Aspergillus udagawae TaxID=91492 RepID=A0A8H3RXL8_9EURO|nr:hypothetical protein IFM46972_04668 [Aspergillus udagawae]